MSKTVTARDKCSGDDEDNAVEVQVILHTTPPVKVLTVYRNENWLLPLFKYPSHRSYQSSFCCEDLKTFLGLEFEEAGFDVVAELLSYECDPFTSHYYRDGTARLTLVTAQSESFFKRALPSHAKWSEIEPLLQLFRSWRYNSFRGYAYRYLNAFTDIDPTIWDPRSEYDWVYRATRYLKSTVRKLRLEPTSDVQRDMWISPSELFKVNTREGWYYLKCPSAGFEEVRITECISKLFPQDTLDLVSTNTELNCFVAKGFEKSDDVDSNTSKLMLRKLARLQLESIKHLDKLKDAGLPDSSPTALAVEVDKWFSHPTVKQQVTEKGLSTEEVTNTLKGYCARLNESPIPLTLVHGDFEIRNFGFRADVEQDGGWILFDWGYACISHPFSDLFSVQGWPSDELEEYFRCWERFVSIEEAQETFQIAVIVGLMASLKSAMTNMTVGTKGARHLGDGYVSSCIDRLMKVVREKAGAP